MPFTTASSAGTSDEVFLRRLREFMEDLPLFSPEQVSPNGTMSEYKLSRFPVLDGDPYLTVTVGGSPQTVVSSRSAIPANSVYIDYETGWMFWGTPPPAGSNSIQVRKSMVRWRNEKMLEALYTGLRSMFPKVWQSVTDTSIQLVTNQYDYTLPSVFNDPRVSLFKVEFLEYPGASYRYHQLTAWRRIGNTTLQIPNNNAFPPGTTLRLSFAGPYQSLGDLEDQLTPLPLWYAKGFLLSNKEIVRARISTANITQDENAQPVGQSQNAGQFFFNQFYQALNSLARPMPFAPVMLAASM